MYSIAAATQGLLRRFRSRRPVRGGSLLVTIFGDAIAPRGGVVTLGSLIRLAAPFGLTERLVRTSVARLAHDGWLIARREGRLSEYRLTENGAQRFAEATRRIYGQSPDRWDGQWTLLLLTQSPGRRRELLREELRWLGFGQVSPGVFAHPDGNLGQARAWLRNLSAGKGAVLLKCSSEGAAADREIVAAGWDLGELTRRYRRFVDTFEPVQVAAGIARTNGDGNQETAGRVWPARKMLSAQSAFVIRTLLIHDYRKIHLQDPLLPPALLPDDWVGSRAYELCAGLYARVFAAAESYLSSTASTIGHPLPPAHPSAYRRFGGIGA